MSKDSSVKYLHYLKGTLNSRAYDVAKITALEKAQKLSKRLGCEILLKREDHQPIFCYKIRGAYNKMVHLDRDQLDRGVVAASAGNHAQGVALSAQKLGCNALIVMPKTTPEIKVDAVKNLGAKTKLVGNNYTEAYEYAKSICKAEDRVYISPFDDPLIIQGQATVGLEILQQNPGALDAIFIPVGGGGLIAGIAGYIKQLRPEIKIIGVEPFESDALYQSLKKGRRIQLDKVGIFADGVAVKQVGRENFKLCREFVDMVVRVSTDEICAAIKDIYEDTRTLVEPSGALAVAGIKRWIKDQSSAEKSVKVSSSLRLAAIISGANINFDRLRHVSERAEIGEKHEAIIAVTIPEERGSFRRFYRTLGMRTITEFNYRFANDNQAHIFVGIQIKQVKEVNKLIRKLSSKGIPAIDLTDDEVAKVHIRHLVGGRVPDVENERFFSFEFPERPGALGRFLDQIGNQWNISMFHYRNHGSDFGRVLCGIQVPDSSEGEFNRFLEQLGYGYHEETNNLACQLFLR